jgi:serine/threonine protein kinase
MPYSSLECFLGTPEGFNKSEIDLWSISLIIYELMFKKIPFFYNKWVGGDIVKQWTTSLDFSFFPIYRKKRGWLCIYSIFSLVAIRGIQINQKNRLSLQTQNLILS